MNHSKGFGKKAVLFLGMVTAVTLLFAVAAFAGWNTTDNGKKVTYTDETGRAVTGYRMIMKDGQRDFRKRTMPPAPPMPIPSRRSSGTMAWTVTTGWL